MNWIKSAISDLGKYGIFFLILNVIMINTSCHNDQEQPYEEMEEEDCTYQFGTPLEPIEGIWEPEAIIDIETGDTTFYEIGEGHGGFFFNDHYGDAFELRENNEISTYYVEHGRHCASLPTGNWIFREDHLIIELVSDFDTLSVLALSEDQLVMENIINFRESVAIMRKMN